MALSPSLVTFLEHHKKPAKRFKVNIAFSAIRRPTTFHLTDGDVGLGHEVDPETMVVPRLGPDRVALKGEAVRFYAGDSYVRGGGAAVIEDWTAYYLGTEAPIDTAFGGTEVPSTIVSPSPDGGGNVATATFTPTQAGHYRIEMHAFGMLLTGDGITAPYPNACRFVRVFDTDPITGDQNQWDGEGVAQIGINGSIEQGGHQATLTMKRGRGFGGVYPVENQRVIFSVKTWYRIPQVSAWAEYTWNPGHGTTDYIWYSPNVFFEGYVRGSGVVEDYLTGDVTIQLSGVRVVLDQLAFPTTIKDIPDEETGEPSGLRDSVPTSFIDTAAYDAIMSEAKESEDFMWVHRIAGMKYSDVTLHLLTRHSDFCTFNDAAIWQNATDSVPYVELRAGNVFGFLRELEQQRLGVVFGDAKGVLYAGPDLDLRGSDYWATVTDPDFVADGDLYRDIHIQMQPPEVGQVSLSSVDQRDLLPAAFAPDIGDDILQVIQRKQYTALWPSERGPGTIFELHGVPIFDRSALATVARKMERKLNKHYPSIQMTFQMLTGIDLGQNVAVSVTPRSAYPTGGLDGLLAHVTGVQMTINPNGLSWSTTLTCAETVDAASVLVPDIGPTAAFSATAFREVLADGTEKRFILLQSRAREGDEPIAQYLWQSDNGGGAKTGTRAVYAYDESADTVTIIHDVIDMNGLSASTSRIVDLSALPANAATFGETLWAASDKGHHVSPDGGLTWLEDTTIYPSVPATPTVGKATAVWATDDSNYGFFGNDGTVAGKVGVFLTRDLGKTFVMAAGMPASAVRTLWGDPGVPSAFAGYANGQLWEVAWSKKRSVLTATEVSAFRAQMGNAAPITFVFFSQGMLFVAAGEYFYAGSRSDWRRLARFPGTILRGAARAQLAGDAFAGDDAFTFVVSLVFASGGQNWQEQGRVRVGGGGVEWFTESIVPIPSGSGADTAVGALDQAAPILLSFDAANVPYLLPSAGHPTPGPAIVPATAVPSVTGIRAVEYGYGGRDHAFLGHDSGIYKNFDPNREPVLPGVPAPSNIWIPFHATASPVRDLYVTRPKEGVAAPEQVTYNGVNYIAINDNGSTDSVIIVVWSPNSTPPQYVVVDSFDAPDAGEFNFAVAFGPSASPVLNRIRSVSAGRDRAGEDVVLPPGFSSLTQFALCLFGTTYQTMYLSWNDSTLLYQYGGGVLTPHYLTHGQSDGALGGGHNQGGYYGRGGNVWTLVGSTVVGQVSWGWAHDIHNEPGAWGQWPRHYERAYYGPSPTGGGPTGLTLSGRRGPVDGTDWRAYGYAGPQALRSHDGDGVQRAISTVAPSVATEFAAGTYLMEANLIADGDLLSEVSTVFVGGVSFDGSAEGWDGVVFYSNNYLTSVPSQGTKLFYLPSSGVGAPPPSAALQEVLFDGAAAPILQCEAFDEYWCVSEPLSATWKLWRRTSATTFTRVIPDLEVLPEGSVATPRTWDSAWQASGPLTANALTGACTIAVYTGGIPMLVVVYDDGTWEDRTGNLYEDVTVGEDTALAVQSGTTLPIALRHVLASEFAPVQMAL